MTPDFDTAVQSGAMHGTEVTQRPSLLRAEALRLASRRLVRLLLVLGFLSILVGSVLIFFGTGKPSAAEISAAKAQAQQMYHAASSLPAGALVVLAGFAVLFFMIGATAGGAEWAAKTLPSLLAWEPRRTRVIITKLLVLCGFTLIASVLAAALWLGLALLIAHFHGEWSERAASAIRLHT